MRRSELAIASSPIAGCGSRTRSLSMTGGLRQPPSNTSDTPYRSAGFRCLVIVGCTPNLRAGSDIGDIMVEAVERRIGRCHAPSVVRMPTDDGYPPHDVHIVARLFWLRLASAIPDAPESNGLLEAFAHDHVQVAPLPDTRTVQRTSLEVAALRPGGVSCLWPPLKSEENAHDNGRQRPSLA